jgi:hypothetical protein
VAASAMMSIARMDYRGTQRMRTAAWDLPLLASAY